MAERNQDFDLFYGEIHTLVIDVSDKNSEGAALVLTGSTCTWLMLLGSTTILTKTVGSGITLSTTKVGRMSIALSAANCSQTAGTYTHEARVTLADGTIATIFLGSITIHPSAI